MKKRHFCKSKSSHRWSGKAGLAVFALGIVSVLGVTSFCHENTFAATVKDGLRINPVYQRYLSDVSAGRASEWKLIPQKYLDPTTDQGGRGDTGALPASYNLTTAGYATNIKNQGTDGICWAFAATTALESTLKKTRGVSVELSPKQLDYLISDGTPYGTYLHSLDNQLSHAVGSGGNFYIAALPFAGQYTPIQESKFFRRLQANDASLRTYNSWNQYEDSRFIDYAFFGGSNAAYSKPLSNSEIMGDTSDYLASEYKIYTSSRSSVNEIKSGVYNYGAAFVGTYAPETDNCWDANTKTIIDRGTTCGTSNAHAMSIVGWDDNHAYTSPVDGSTKHGAFLLQNSYGKDSLINDYGVTVDAIMATLDTSGMSNEQIATLRTNIQNILNNYTADEFVWLGYEFEDSTNSTITFASFKEVRDNIYENAYDPAFSEEKNLAATSGTIINTYTTRNGAEYVDAVSLGARVALRYDLNYDIYIDDSGNGSNYQKVATISIPAGDKVKKMVDLADPVRVDGRFSVKTVATYNGAQVDFSNDLLAFFDATAYTVGEEFIVVPSTAGVDVNAPNTGVFTGDGKEIFGSVATITLIVFMSGLAFVGYKNRKSLLHKIGFEEKEF